MKNLLIAGLLTLGFGCTAAQKAEEKKIFAMGVADVRSASILLAGWTSAVRANATTIEEVLQWVVATFPLNADLSALDAEAQAWVKTIQTSSDRQVLETAAVQLIAKLKNK